MTDLTDNDILRLQQGLLARREELRGLIHEALLDTRREEYVDLAGQVHDSGDESIAEMLLGIDISSRSRELQEMQDVEAALERIRNGVYGVCIACGAPIVRERLEAYPTAKRCLRCQNNLEARRRGGTDATPSL
jgi:RNA polymerase-binding transcription factor